MACACMQLQVCFERYICVRRYMFVAEAGAGERGRECERETKIIFYLFILF